MPERLLPCFCTSGEVSLAEDEFETLEKALVKHNAEKLWQRLGKSDLSIKECHRYLQRQKLAGQYREKIITWGQEHKLLDDARLADNLAYWAVQGGLSRVEAYTKMLRRGLAAGLIKTALSQSYNADSDRELLRTALEKAIKRYSVGERQKILTWLYRRGFNTGDAARMLATWGED